MNKIKLFFIAFLTLVNYSLAQNQNWVIGADANYNIPIAGLANRLEANFGALIYAGKNVDEKWTWLGKFEYFKLTDVNKDKMFKFVKTDVNNNSSEYKFELQLLKMDLTVAGLSVEARYNLFSNQIFESDLNIGFGFYYWEYNRSSYYDSLFVDVTGTGNLVFLELLDVPALKQKDWSGGINFGADFNILLLDPFYFNLGVNYKLIIGELWPTLSLNLENVSGMQFIDFRAGFKVKL